MRILTRYFLCLTLAMVLLGACAQKEPEQPPATPEAPAAQPAQPSPPAKQEAAPAPAQPAPAAQTAAPTPSAPQPAEAKPAATPAPSTAPAPQSVPAQPEKPAESKLTPAEKPAPAPAKAVPKDVVILKAALGGVRFEHKLHAEARKIACETCHHPSRAEKPNAAPQQACATCHTPTATAPMKTKLQAAFHNPAATAGTCINCHKAEVAKGKPAPVKCLDCHKKENK